MNNKQTNGQKIKKLLTYPCGCVLYQTRPAQFKLCGEHNYPEFKTVMLRGADQKKIERPVFV